jgi:hypothetical protein
MQPVEVDFFDFDPAISHWRHAALVESLGRRLRARDDTRV